MKKIFRIIAACSVFFLGVSSCYLFTGGSESEPDIVGEQWTKNSDWLFLFYFDADNNLNDDIYLNMKEAEYSLSLMRNEDGTAKDGFPSVNMVLLWDGASEKQMRENSLLYKHPDGAIYELGADTTVSYYEYDDAYGTGQLINLGTEFSVSKNTQEIKTSWLSKEPDMADYKTLKNFLIWANAHYKAENVVLCLANHGAGTYKEIYSNINSFSRSQRTVCYDDTSTSNKAITALNIKNALEAAVYTGENQIDVIWMDACLQSTVEIANILSGSASYLLASPNTSVSHDYVHAFKNFSSTMTPEDFGKIMVSEYYQKYYENPFPSDELSSSGVSMYTMSLISLDEERISKMNEAVDAFADELLALKNTDFDAFNKIYKNYLKQYEIDEEDVESSKIYEEHKGLVYEGSYVYLADVGYFANDIVQNYEGSLKSAAEAVLDSLDSSKDGVLVYCWGGKRGITVSSRKNAWSKQTENQMYLTGGKDFISGETIETELSGDFYGITITTQEIYKQLNCTGNYNNFTGYSSKWGRVIAAWNN